MATQNHSDSRSVAPERIATPSGTSIHPTDHHEPELRWISTDLWVVSILDNWAIDGGLHPPAKKASIREERRAKLHAAFSNTFLTTLGKGEDAWLKEHDYEAATLLAEILGPSDDTDAVFQLVPTIFGMVRGALREGQAQPTAPEPAVDEDSDSRLSPAARALQTLLDTLHPNREDRAKQWFILDDAIEAVALKLATHPGTAYPARLMDELQTLVDVRFPDLYTFEEYVPHVMRRLAERMYEAGLEAGRGTPDPPSAFSAAEIAAIAVSDHDCPGAHD